LVSNSELYRITSGGLFSSNSPLDKLHITEIIEFLPDATFVLDEQRRVVAWNRAMEAMTGIMKQDIIGKGDYCYMIPFYGEPLPGLIDLIFDYDEQNSVKYDFVEQDGFVLRIEIYIPTLNCGRGAYLWAAASPLFDEEGHIIGSFESIRDITKRIEMEQEIKRHHAELQTLVEERTRELQDRTRELSEVNTQLRKEVSEHQKTEKTLREVNQRLTDIIEFLPDATVVVDQDNRIIAWNRAMVEQSGVPKEEMLGKGNRALSLAYYGIERPNLMDLVFTPQPHDRKLYDVAGKDGSTIFSEEYCPLPNKDHGAYLWGTASPFYDSQGNLVGAIQCTRDISQRKQADKDLRLAKERFRKAFDASPAIMAVSEVADGRYLYVNDKFVQALGFTRDELIGISALKLNIWSNPQERVQMVATLNQHGSVRNHLAHIRVKNGSIRVGLLSVEKIEFDGKQRLLIAMNDITELKETEELLRRSEERFAKAFYSAPYAMAITDYATGCHIIVNDSFLKLTGFKREEVIGYSQGELKFWMNLDMPEQLKMLHKHGIVQNYDVQFKTKGGMVRNAHLSAVLIELDGDQRLLITIDDITDQKQIQQEVARLERLNLIGQMAAGIGHEIRNPMTSVRGFLQILGSKSELVGYQSWFDLMIDELDRANSIITEYLSLAKNKPVKFCRLCLNNILEAIAPLINADALNEDKNVEWRLQEIPKILLDSEEMRQLILNLVRNGLEAMTAGGTLTITTYIDGPDTVLAVQDHGGGITLEVLEKLGTPFVTTKEMGTGLGLPVCYAIAARHQATIDVDTGPNGTTFKVRFKTGNFL